MLLQILLPLGARWLIYCALILFLLRVLRPRYIERQVLLYLPWLRQHPQMQDNKCIIIVPFPRWSCSPTRAASARARWRWPTYTGSLWGSHNSCNLAISAGAHACSYLPSSPCLRPLDPIYVPRKIGLPRWKGHSYMMFEKFWQFEGPTPL